MPVMQKSYSPDATFMVTFMITYEQHTYPTTVTCSEKPAKAGDKKVQIFMQPNAPNAAIKREKG